MKLDPVHLQLYTAEQLVLSDETVSFINKAADLTPAKNPASSIEKVNNLKSSKSPTPAKNPASFIDNTANLKSSKSPTPAKNPASFIDNIANLKSSNLKSSNLKSSKSPTQGISTDAVLIVDTGKAVHPGSCKSPVPVCNTETESIVITEDVKPNEEVWIVIGRTYLFRTDKQVLDDDNEWLNDNALNCC